MTPIEAAYQRAASSAATLLGDPAVAACWEQPSALAEFRVSGLAGHLAWQVLSVPHVLALPVPAGEPLALLEHYARAGWVAARLDSDVHVGIRHGGEDIAAVGAAALAAQVGAAVDELSETLAAEPADRLVDLPWSPWSLSLEDFLLTRMMELAVHSDDLAVSVGVPTPALPATVLTPVLSLLSQLAVRRHGSTAVLRALSRAERAPATIAAF
jgi:hypothetical protein